MGQLAVYGVIIALSIFGVMLMVRSTKRRIEDLRFQALLQISDINVREKAIILFVNRYPRFRKKLTAN